MTNADILKKKLHADMAAASHEHCGDLLREEDCPASDARARLAALDGPTLLEALMASSELCKRLALANHGYNAPELESCGDHDVCIDWRVSRDTDVKDAIADAAVALEVPR